MLGGADGACAKSGGQSDKATTAAVGGGSRTFIAGSWNKKRWGTGSEQQETGMQLTIFLMRPMYYHFLDRTYPKP